MIQLPRAIYFILLDRFSTGESTLDKKLAGKLWQNGRPKDYSQAFMGGNLRGVINNFDYIKNLGIDCIWLSPIFETSAYHGYHVTNFFKIDKRFGEDEDLKSLVNLCHKNGIKIILDFVPNHCSRFHPHFLDAQKNPESQYRNWFIFLKWPKTYLSFLDVADIPKLNLENQKCRNYILESAKYWLAEFDIDGYRIDHAIGPPFDFWQDFIKVVAEVKNDAILLPEIWFRGVNLLHTPTLWYLRENKKWRLNRIISSFLSSQNQKQDYCYKLFSNFFDIFLDFTFLELIQKHFFEPETLKRLVSNHFSKLEKPNSYLFLDNHDTSRFIYLCQNDEKEFTENLKLLFSFGKPTVFYYGTEIGMSHQNPERYRLGKDREARRFMNWNFGAKEEKILKLTQSLIKNLRSQK